MNGIAQFDTSGNPITNTRGFGKGSLAPGKAFSYDASGDIIGTHSVKDDASGKYGAKIKARNGSIVKAIKNL
jgi:hypothetical protein